ncbi:LysE family translocator [Rhodococcus sp. MSC1_016]|jgi:threonine/homoserine/homoserine lactone efflux protein|uniref:LysE family translocator n=1 Tax=Rhodococcus sp. MSC1_016 TaxID=2909266 RepID=UPI00202FC264|nr:LysE family translocator [Rhodococcus sp. MSC1_016]
MVSALLTATAVLALLTLVPGPDMAVVTQATVSGTRTAGLKVAVGVGAGLLVWGALTVAGLSALLAASAEAYTAVKLLGAAYLLYLGLSALRRSRNLVHYAADVSTAAHRVPTMRTGITTNLLNPKIAVFYTGVLTQLVPAGWPVGPALALLVGIHAALTMAWLSTYVALLARLRTTFTRPRVRRALDRVTGTVLVGFGTTIALQTRP